MVTFLSVDMATITMYHDGNCWRKIRKVTRYVWKDIMANGEPQQEISCLVLVCMNLTNI
jgi:hypothetical protein